MASSVDVNPRLKASVRDEPKQMLQPISGYEDEPLLSLEEACQPLKKIMDKELVQNVTIAKLNSTEPEDGLTEDESASIHLYTMEWKVPENSLYAVLNRALRLVDRRKLQPWLRYLKLFLTAFFKLPPTEHRTVWRGVPEDLSNLYPRGKAFAWWGISSCTSSISLLECSQYAGSSGARTMFSIETNNGKLIRSHSYFQHEDEILLPPGIYLQVIDKFSSADGLNIIHLREVSPPYKTLADPFDLSQWKQALPQLKSSSHVSSSRKKQENDPSTTITPKSSKQSSSKKEKPHSTASNEKSPYSDKQLRCEGRACARCGYCRDWYWRPLESDDDDDSKSYTKRAGASCIYRDRDRSGWHSGYDYVIRLCECEDNRS